MHRTLGGIVGSSLIGALVLVLLSLPACQRDPAEQIARARADYSAELLAFALQRTEVEEPLVGLREEEEGEAPPVEEDGELEATEPEPATQDIILDILVHWRGFDRLPGLTLDITHVDAAEREKGRYHLWVDTSRLERGPGEQITHVLEDVAYEEGDGFHVGVRRQVPEEERHLYREFAEAH